MRDHEVYEALAGAVLLGEASVEERQRYALHAATCPSCGTGLEATRTLVGAAFVGAKHGETWRAHLRDDVLARIARGRTLGTRRMTFVLSGAVVAALALNVALALGLGAPWSRPASGASESTVSVATPAISAPNALLHNASVVDVQVLTLPREMGMTALRDAGAPAGEVTSSRTSPDLLVSPYTSAIAKPAR